MSDVSKIQQLVMQHLQEKHGIVKPAQSGLPEAGSPPEYNDYWTANTVSSAVANAVQKATQGRVMPDARSVPIQALADTAFEIGRIAREKNALDYRAVVLAYVTSVAGSGEPEPISNSVDNAEFKARTFPGEGSNRLSGATLLQEAIVKAPALRGRN